MTEKCASCPVLGACLGVTPGRHGYAIPRYCELAAKDYRYDEVIRRESEQFGDRGSVSFSTSKKSRELVVARYREPLDWVNGLRIPITVYNKGEPLSGLDGRVRVVPVPNRGREADSYLRYIVDRYESLPELVLLSQGHPFDHSDRFLERLSLDYAKPTTLTTRYKPDCPAQWIKDLDRVEYVDGYECRYGDALIEGHGNLKAPWFDVRQWDRLFADPLPSHVWFGYGACLAVPRESIRCRPREWYRWLLSILDSGESGSSYTEQPNPWSMEALWLSIFECSLRIKPVPRATVDKPPASPARKGCGCGKNKPRANPR